MKKEQEFLVLKDAEGLYRPSYFVSKNDEAGILRAEKVKLDIGDQIVIVTFVEARQ